VGETMEYLLVMEQNSSYGSKSSD